MKLTLGRLLIRAAAVARSLVWTVLRPRTVGTLMLVADDAGRVMLVEHSYETGVLRLPGGGVKRGELLAECARRELREETGLVVDDIEALELLGVYSGREGAQSAFLAVFVAPAGSWKGTPSRSAEIDAAEFYDPANPPPETSPATRARLAEFVAGQRGVSGRWG